MFTINAIERGYVKHYEDTPCGRGSVTFTDEVADALTFTTMAEAFNFWRQQSRSVPLRPDGRANRPMCAFSVWIEEVPARSKH